MIKFGVVFLFLLALAALVGLARPRFAGGANLSAAVLRNQQVTAVTGIVLYVLLVVLAVTVIDVRRFLTAHFVVGLLLVPPVILKLGSTGYRFVRYYSGSEPFRAAGTPPPLLRFVVAPVLVVSTGAVFVTGLELWLFGLRFGSVWIAAHSLSAVLMMLAVGVHLIAHMRVSADAFAGEVALRRQRTLSPRSLVAATVVFGVALAAASLFYASPFTASFAGG